MEKKEYRAIDIPSLIRFVREKEGMTQKEFAETFRFKASSPSMWELGKREAPYKILEFVFSRWLEQELDKAREEGCKDDVEIFMEFLRGHSLVKDVHFYRGDGEREIIIKLN